MWSQCSWVSNSLTSEYLLSQKPCTTILNNLQIFPTNTKPAHLKPGKITQVNRCYGVNIFDVFLSYKWGWVGETWEL